MAGLFKVAEVLWRKGSPTTQHVPRLLLQALHSEGVV